MDRLREAQQRSSLADASTSAAPGSTPHTAAPGLMRLGKPTDSCAKDSLQLVQQGRWLVPSTSALPPGGTSPGDAGPSDTSKKREGSSTKLGSAEIEARALRARLQEAEGKLAAASARAATKDSQITALTHSKAQLEARVKDLHADLAARCQTYDARMGVLEAEIARLRDAPQPRAARGAAASNQVAPDDQGHAAHIAQLEARLESATQRAGEASDRAHVAEAELALQKADKRAALEAARFAEAALDTARKKEKELSQKVVRLMGELHALRGNGVDTKPGDNVPEGDGPRSKGAPANPAASKLDASREQQARSRR